MTQGALARATLPAAAGRPANHLRTAVPHRRYFEIYLPCPRCQTQIEAEVMVAGYRVEVLRHELCPNELGVDGHTLNEPRDLHTTARFALATAGLI
jgi:hypothetical protein